MPILAVTFDCWSTLIHERDPAESHALRVAAVARSARVAEADARRALDEAWGRHVALWSQGVGSGSPEMARWTLEGLGAEVTPERVDSLARALAESALASKIVALEGAADTLAELAEAGIRRALVCDTGFSPGRVVRQLLDRAGLLARLEVMIFSDEAGVPKPHPRVFHQALAPLHVAPAQAVHVGDLRRTDVAGARAAGLGSVRIRQHHDDLSEHPDADHVVESHAELRGLWGRSYFG
jgi:putative hydrolase of the HAD superfamily